MHDADDDDTYMVGGAAMAVRGVAEACLSPASPVADVKYEAAAACCSLCLWLAACNAASGTAAAAGLPVIIIIFSAISASDTPAQNKQIKVRKSAITIQPTKQQNSLSKAVNALSAETKTHRWNDIITSNAVSANDKHMQQTKYICNALTNSQRR